MIFIAFIAFGAVDRIHEREKMLLTASGEDGIQACTALCKKKWHLLR